MKSDAERWDERYRTEDRRRRSLPDAFALSVFEELGPGAGRRALDLACGLGRHALELARRGWRVDAWDVSGVALELLRERADAEGLEVGLRRCDLACSRLPDGAAGWDLIVLVNYLDPELTSGLHRSLAPGGLLLYRTWTREHDGAGPPPHRCLEARELADGLAGLRTLRYEEEGGRAGLLAVREESA